jgi:parallel beta-helix repeat protein
VAIVLVVWLLLPVSAFAGSVVRSASGANAAAIAATIDTFRNDLGGQNNGAGAPAASGRREINWDGVPDNFASPNNLPANFFNVNSPRGAVFTTPGTGFRVSATNPVEFGDIDPVYPSYFATNSPVRLFTAIGSTVTDVEFFVPGTTNPATVSGFGAVFTDVDTANVTSIQFFGLNGVSFGTFFVPNVASNQTLSFLGVSFNAGERVARVRITCGNQVLAPGNVATDSVVMDDFIYGEPQIIPVQNLNTGKFFPTIQTAIVAADTTNGHVIEVKPGTYSELVTVNKSITLRGAKAGVDARSASRGTGESIVNGAVLNGLHTSAFHVTVNNVKIDGFTVQEAMHGNQHGAGIVLAPTTSGAQISNNIIRDNRVGLYLSSLDTKLPALIERNLFQNNNNPDSGAGFGIYSDESIAGGPLRNVVINENAFTGHNTGAVNLTSNQADLLSRLVISNNSMTGNGIGIYLSNTTNSKITRNTISGANASPSGGVHIQLVGGVNALSIEENRIQQASNSGIFVTNLIGAPNTNISINCNLFSDNVQSALTVTAGSYTDGLGCHR